LFVEEFVFASDIAAVELGGDVFAEGADVFAGDDFAADGGLEGDLEGLFGDDFLELFDDAAAEAKGFVAVGDETE
jgi:hypothetical protein